MERCLIELMVARDANSELLTDLINQFVAMQACLQCTKRDLLALREEAVAPIDWASLESLWDAFREFRRHLRPIERKMERKGSAALPATTM
ncbi:hypothetical protein OE88DRAFT_1096873 [Heliocybe sulcata]|uniref:Uncharacterized protein n=1 Tax=Heliocybe sulcata TaxID=5364 RepID=A0A5C3MM08_9AGAM|nr:hypothetical protein OE88DRAFT_1096873 [Heliocybe sulcata]